MLMAAKQAPPNPPFTTEGMPTPAGRREPIGIDRPSIRQCRNTLCLFRVGVSGRSRQEKPTKAGSESPESKKNDFVKSRLMSDSSAGRLDPNQPVLGGAATTQSLKYRPLTGTRRGRLRVPWWIRRSARPPRPC